MLRQTLAQRAHIVDGRVVIVTEADEDVAIGRANHAGIAIGQIDAAIRQAKRVNNVDQFFLGDGLADHVFDTVGQARRFLDTQAGLGTEVQFDLAAVDIREEVAAQPRHQQRYRKRATAEEQDREQPTVLFRGYQRIAITFTCALEASFESCLETSERAFGRRLSVRVFLQPVQR